MGENSREIILDTLLTLEKGDEFSHRLIKAVLDKYDYLDGREKAFIKRVTEGTIERQPELDYYLNQFSTVQVRKMKPLIRCLLRMSTYQLLYMDAVPDSAVCNEACKLAARRKFNNLKGFVNGILRNIAKNKEMLPLPDRKKNLPEYFSVKYSMPKWLVKKWMAEYGDELTETILAGLLAVHPVSLRFRTDGGDGERQKLIEEMERQGVRLCQSSYLPYVYHADNVESVSGLPGFLDGSFMVQDVSSALAVAAAGIKQGDFVVDVCAAPGGKSLLAAEYAGKAGRVLSRDVSEGKMALIEENRRRMRAENVQTQMFDATRPDEALFGKADVLLLDVPCSGLGVMGKKRDIKYNVSEESLADIVKLQKRIVEGCFRYVRPGGILLYSTCTINTAENEEMVRWILDNLPFEAVSIDEVLPETLLEQKKAYMEKSGGNYAENECSAWLQLLPGLMESDGFFFAKLLRR